MISVLIITKNEEHDLSGCLDSVAWSDDVHVFDSYSTDRTAEIARSHGAYFTQHRFDTYAAQKNAALTGVTFKYDWIFLLDADERPTRELTAEMLRAVSAAPEGLNGFSMRRRDFFLNKWLKHAQLTPLYIRLVRKGKASYWRDVNEVLKIDGSVGTLTSSFDHYPFSKGITHWLSKHNVYSSMEAELIASGAAQENTSWKDALSEKDYHKRRAALKAIFYQAPGRPLIKWIYLLFWRGGILDGRAGITYATLQAIYEYLIVLKTREILERHKLESNSEKA